MKLGERDLVSAGCRDVLHSLATGGGDGQRWAVMGSLKPVWEVRKWLAGCRA